MVGVGSGDFGALIGGLLARSFGLAAPFWFAAAVMVLIALASLPFVNNRTVAEARAAARRRTRNNGPVFSKNGGPATRRLVRDASSKAHPKPVW